jgi:hypothetical protein
MVTQKSYHAQRSDARLSIHLGSSGRSTGGPSSLPRHLREPVCVIYVTDIYGLHRAYSEDLRKHSCVHDTCLGQSHCKPL